MVSLTSPNRNDRARLQEREQGGADRTSEKRVGGLDPIESTGDSVCRESVAAAGNHDLQQEVVSPRRETDVEAVRIVSMIGVEGELGERCKGESTGEQDM